MYTAGPAAGQHQPRAGQSIPVRQPQQPPQQSGLLKSSLDIVWSYSRSQAFYGSNLDCNPSFISRYRRPGHQDEDEEDDDGDEDEDDEDGEDDDGVRGEAPSDAESGRKPRRRTRGSRGAQSVTHGQPASRDSSLASTEDDTEDASDTGRARRHTRRHTEDGLPDLDSPIDDRFSSPDRHTSSRRQGRGLSPAERRPSNSVERPNKTKQTHARRPSDQPSYLAGGSSLGLSLDPVSAYGPSESGDSSAVNSSDADGRSTDGSHAQHPLRLSERSPLLPKKRSQPGHLHHAIVEEDEAIYGSSPPDTVPFPRRSPGMSLRKRSSGAGTKLRRKSSAAKRFNPQGSSTFGQTLFNAINVLIGIGILALPLAFSQAGWILGILLLIFCSALTNYTAKVLARALYDDPRLMTYADIGAKAFGAPARTFINILFCLEISALCVALIILLGDSLAIIFPLKPVYFKLIGFACLFPTLFLPLRYLSVASLIGIISVVTLTGTVLVDGIISHEQPGSLRHPMPTSIGPQWRMLPISFGLVMSGFGGHAVFPSLARDIKNPQDFNKVCNLAFLVATTFYLLMGTVGYLMFGHTVTDEITRDLLHTPTLPRKLNLVAVAMVAITPVCKYAISSTPLDSTVCWLLGVEQEPEGIILERRGSGSKGSDWTEPSYSTFSEHSSSNMTTPRARTAEVNQSTISAVLSSVSQPLADIKPKFKAVVRQIVKLVTSLTLLAIAIFIPSFDRVMGLLGAFSVFMICAIGPLAANLALFRKTMSKPVILMNWVLLLISVAMGAIGTVFVFLPKHQRV
ncbi:hypothetical protein P389DRAFT_4127 [Cystobasidium minutum MCA 4210]|uniref:uncharacterized protein n=1 Tax=Cystobasidium minutum MCA 4210 TaxID=1397322 RepID=UPI0034CEA37A|eukprot:jgi/Rhomi1/4127/CE4126_1481